LSEESEIEEKEKRRNMMKIKIHTPIMLFFE
jgi:hypothetical protein